MKAIAWDVFLIREDEKHVYQECIDTVFFDSDCNAQYVHSSLVNHDGYDPNIIVRNYSLHQEIHSTYCDEDIEEYAYCNEKDIEAMYVYPVENNL